MTPPITLASYNLKDPADVQRLAIDLGRIWSEAIAPLVTLTAAEHRAMFFGYLFSSPFGAMSAAIGMDDMRVIVEELMRAARTVSEERKRVLN